MGAATVPVVLALSTALSAGSVVHNIHESKKAKRGAIDAKGKLEKEAERDLKLAKAESDKKAAKESEIEKESESKRASIAKRNQDAARRRSRVGSSNRKGGTILTGVLGKNPGVENTFAQKTLLGA